MNVPVIWVNRHGEKLEGRKKPDAEVKTFRDAAAQASAQVAPPMAPGAPTVHRDPADEAMVARAHERFAAERRRQRAASDGEAGARCRTWSSIGGLKCGTTSLHHYLNLHPADLDVAAEGAQLLRRGAELGAGPDWYGAHFDPAAAVRGETSPHYTDRPRFEGVAERMRELLGADAQRRLHGPRPDRPAALPLPAQRGRRLREPPAGRGVRPTGHGLRPPQPLRLPARAIPRGLRARAGAASSPARS